MDGAYTGVAGFSSRGPASDGRIKPDLLAPGEKIASVRSDGDLSSNQCDANLGSAGLIVATASGTSMSTPVVAANALLVRQYFEEGWYPSGSRLGSPLPHLRRDWAHPSHICAGTGRTPATSAPGLGPPLPHLRRDSARFRRPAACAPPSSSGWARRC